MSCLSSDRVARIKARISVKEATLLKLDTALSEAAISIKEYRIDSGDGSQRTEYRDIGEIRRQIDVLESEIEVLYRKLSGTGIVNMSLRRKNG